MTKEQILDTIRECGFEIHHPDELIMPTFEQLQAFAQACLNRGAAQREKELLATGMGPVGAVYRLRGVVHCTLTQEIGDTDLHTATQFAAARLQGERSRDAEVERLKALHHDCEGQLRQLCLSVSHCKR